MREETGTETGMGTGTGHVILLGLADEAEHKDSPAPLRRWYNRRASKSAALAFGLRVGGCMR